MMVIYSMYNSCGKDAEASMSHTKCLEDGHYLQEYITKEFLIQFLGDD